MIESIKGKKILILGYGKEGSSTLNYLLNIVEPKYITIADKSEKIKNDISISNSKISVITGENYLYSIDNFDIVFKSPGISFKDILIKDISKISSQTNIFINKYYKNIIGITGTKGKSTTTSLIYNIIKCHTDNVLIAGNIGIPFFDCISKIDDKTLIVCELSSHQLEYLNTSPHISILLNIFQEHLDHYKTFEDYQKAKLNIAKYQTENDYFIHNIDDTVSNKIINETQLNSRNIKVSSSKSIINGCEIKENLLIFKSNGRDFMNVPLTENIPLKGKHNLYNIAQAVYACFLSGIPQKAIIEGISTFKPLEHRIEYIGTYKGVKYYNDSISTIPEATIEAVKTLKDVNTIILGGFDREIDYKKLSDFIISSDIENLIFMGNAGIRIKELVELNIKNKKSYIVKNLEEAVIISAQRTKIGKTCLLSPAAASYDMFKNFEDRGNQFKQLVKKI